MVEAEERDVGLAKMSVGYVTQHTAEDKHTKCENNTGVHAQAQDGKAAHRREGTGEAENVLIPWSCP